MDALVRMRWRLRGAWLWPSFVVLTLIDGVILTALPLAGDSISFVGGWLLAVVISLLAVVVLTSPAGRLVRKLRPDMPKTVARDYAGALVLVLVTAGFLGGGIAHRHVVTADNSALAEATARAEAYIGDHAPTGVQENDRALLWYAVQVPKIYRMCATDVDGRERYCVVVDLSKPFARSVAPAGSESNALLSAGTD